MELPLYEEVFLVLERKYLLRRREFAKLEKFTFSVKKPDHRTLSIYTKQCELLCEWEENWLDNRTKVYHKKAEREVALSREEMLRDIKRQLGERVPSSDIHKDILKYGFPEKRKLSKEGLKKFRE
ncbi:hypothetical protein C8_186 [Cannes 8 virus]|uniref:Uncharacterized protein n=1 Tax=Marseillevirus marseillevirus TaxID=694581 RepID=D2XAI3_GBMV|nr:hypothetical protein MAR_ORF179 [Marseillevirus marseillevirus]YP_009094660.1 hypothetical protein MEL_159 [Melbournevirus]ADB03960.1 hypothetical protein MAR_ORF179 [Marseillevirus marseillevirus]AGV01535.1 hypothetical protein C8_186 [Cannes 8 virus]AIT54772.1 hypothetical protein MEL_159 [Melbournevirus]